MNDLTKRIDPPQSENEDFQAERMAYNDAQSDDDTSVVGANIVTWVLDFSVPSVEDDDPEMMHDDYRL